MTEHDQPSAKCITFATGIKDAAQVRTDEKFDRMGEKMEAKSESMYAHVENKILDMTLQFTKVIESASAGLKVEIEKFTGTMEGHKREIGKELGRHKTDIAKKIEGHEATIDKKIETHEGNVKGELKEHKCDAEKAEKRRTLTFRWLIGILLPITTMVFMYLVAQLDSLEAQIVKDHSESNKVNTQVKILIQAHIRLYPDSKVLFEEAEKLYDK